MAIVALIVNENIILHNIIPMPPDGSSLFHAIAYSIYNTINNEQTQLLRSTIVNYIYNNWDEFNLYTSDAQGDPFSSRHEYKATMLQSFSYGSTAEVKAAGVLYPARFEVYERNTGILRGVFGREGYAIKRLLLSGNLSSGHYDFCSPIGSEELPNNTYDNMKANLVKKTQNAKVGRPKRNKGGRPKKSEKSRSEQVLEAKQKYKQTHPKINRPAIADHIMATDLEEFEGQYLQVNNELAIPATSVYSMAYTSESPTPQSISYTPKHAASSLASESGDTLTQKILSVPRNRKSSKDLKKYNKEKKRVWRNK